MKSYEKVLFTLLLLVLLIGLAVVTAPLQPAQAGPLAAPTPITDVAYSPDRNLVEFMENKKLTADTFTPIVEVSAYERVTTQYTVDQTIKDAIVNTTTVTVYFSNDRVNWVAGPALVSANVADATDMTPVQVFGAYMRYKVDVSNTNPITWTIVSLFK